MKVLYFCTCWLPDLDRVFMLQSWLRVARQQTADILIVDTKSEFHPDVAGYTYRLDDSERCYRFDSNVGHGSREGDQDGWGRAFCKGIELAIEGGYDYAVHVESDMACRVCQWDVIALMEKEGKPFASPYCWHVQNIETGLMYMNVKRLKELDFVARYCWPKIRPEMSIAERIARQPEKVIGGIFGEEWLRLQWRGARIEHDTAAEWQLGTEIFKGRANEIHYFTHVRPAMYDLYTRSAKGEPLPLIRLT